MYTFLLPLTICIVITVLHAGLYLFVYRREKELNDEKKSQEAQEQDQTARETSSVSTRTHRFAPGSGAVTYLRTNYASRAPGPASVPRPTASNLPHQLFSSLNSIQVNPRPSDSDSSGGVDDGNTAPLLPRVRDASDNTVQSIDDSEALLQRALPKGLLSLTATDRMKAFRRRMRRDQEKSTNAGKSKTLTESPKSTGGKDDKDGDQGERGSLTSSVPPSSSPSPSPSPSPSTSSPTAAVGTSSVFVAEGQDKSGKEDSDTLAPEETKQTQPVEIESLASTVSLLQGVNLTSTAPSLDLLNKHRGPSMGINLYPVQTQGHMTPYIIEETLNEDVVKLNKISATSTISGFSTNTVRGHSALIVLCTANSLNLLMLSAISNIKTTDLNGYEVLCALAYFSLILVGIFPCSDIQTGRDWNIVVFASVKANTSAAMHYIGAFLFLVLGTVTHLVQYTKEVQKTGSTSSYVFAIGSGIGLLAMIVFFYYMFLLVLLETAADKHILLREEFKEAFYRIKNKKQGNVSETRNSHSGKGGVNRLDITNDSGSDEGTTSTTTTNRAERRANRKNNNDAVPAEDQSQSTPPNRKDSEANDDKNNQGCWERSKIKFARAWTPFFLGNRLNTEGFKEDVKNVKTVEELIEEYKEAVVLCNNDLSVKCFLFEIFAFISVAAVYISIETYNALNTYNGLTSISN